MEQGRLRPPSNRGSRVIADTERLTNPSSPKVSFDNGGEFIRQTRRDVEEYLSARRIRARGRAELYAKGVVALLRAARLVAHAHARPPRCVARSAQLRRADPRDVADGVLRDARRQSRCLLPEAPPEPPDGLDRRCAAWALQLRLACEAQRCPSHLHERRRLRRRHHPGAVRSAGARPGTPPLVPTAALLHLGALLPDGAPLADRRRCRRVRSGEHRDERPAPASGVGSRRSGRREGDLRQLGNRRADARLSVVGRRRAAMSSTRWS